MIEKITRRDFLQTTAGVAGTGLVLQIPLPQASAQTAAKDQTFAPNVYISITTGNNVFLICHRSEMGQSVRISMPMLIAEELEVDLRRIKVLQAIGDEKYGDQNTDGSTSARKNYEPLRQAGAAAREMLIAAAAKKWKVDPSECFAANGSVVHGKSRRTYTFGRLADDAAKEKVPAAPKLKAVKDFKIIGKPRAGYDVFDMSTGRANYGIDADIKGMVYASLERSPHRGGKVKSLDDTKALAVKGVQKVVKLSAIGPDTNMSASVAVVADNTWSALQGRKALDITWSTPPKHEDFRKTLAKALDGKAKTMLKEGNVKKALGQATTKLKTRYYVPFLAHAQMEPPNATAWVKRGSCEVWAPTQDPQRARRNVAKFLGIKPEKVTINVTLLGGGFGRKSQPDFILEAVALSQKLARAVKVTWTREDDIKHGFYHAASMQDIEAGLDKDGKITAWHHRAAYPSNLTVFDPRAKGAVDWEIGMGASNQPYKIPNVLVESAPVGSPIRIGWLRAVANIQHAFAVNSMMDALAATAGKDPIDYRLEMMGAPHAPPAAGFWQVEEFKQDTGRLAQVMKAVRKMSDWDQKRKSKKPIGFANHYSFFTYVAMTIEATRKDDQVTVEEVNCAVDCGVAVNPDTVRAQLEGGIIFGLSLALHGNISQTAGVIQQANYDSYPVLRIGATPKIKIEIVKSEAAPTGIGEPGVPPVAPALCAALRISTGKDIRELPILPTS